MGPPKRDRGPWADLTGNIESDELPSLPATTRTGSIVRRRSEREEWRMTAPKPGGGAAAAARAAAAAAGPRTVLITGVSRGLGRALALELARRGHAVVGCGRSAEHLRSLEAEITSPSRHFLTVADVVRLQCSFKY